MENELKGACLNSHLSYRGPHIKIPSVAAAGTLGGLRFGNNPLQHAADLLQVLCRVARQTGRR